MPHGKMGWNSTLSMAGGGMIGGGIFSVLGVVVALAGPLAWTSFVAAGAVALITSMSYVRLAAHFHEAGGAFSYLRGAGHPAIAGTLSWILIGGYVLTIAVYGFTFGHYLGAALGIAQPWITVAAVGVVVVFVGVNLLGVGEASGVEVVLVWGKVAVLLVLAAIGLASWNPDALGQGVQGGGVGGTLLGAASVFMAYE
ncbi:MAG TPA: amino acid permease, partial [Actinomycetota bacterium]|nr:amino acid permease [Actinomycetota bacterium]